MIIQSLTPFDSTKQAIEGTAKFRENATYCWSWLIEHTNQQNILISQINAAINEVNEAVDAAIAKAKDVSGNVLLDNKISKSPSADKALMRATGANGDIEGSNVFVDDDGKLILGTAGAYGKINTRTNTPFNPADANLDDTAGVWVESGNAVGLDALGSGIVWSKLAGSSRPACAIVPWQSSADEDQMGLKIFTHSSSLTNDTLTEAISINHLGLIELKGPDREVRLYGTDGIGYGVLDVAGSVAGGVSLKGYASDGSTSYVDISAISTNNAGVYRIGRDSNIVAGQIAEFQIYKHDGTGTGTFVIDCKTGDINTVGAITLSKVGVTAASLDTSGNLFSGTYTPVLTNITNITSSTATACQYMRVGNVVTVSGSVNITANNNIGTLAELRISLPIPSNITAIAHAGGYGGAISTPSAISTGSILGGSGFTNIVAYKFNPYSTSSQTHNFTFTYRII